MFKRTHYLEKEVYAKLRSLFPNISAVTVGEFEYELDIQWSKAGTATLLSVAEFDRLVEAIKTETLIEKDGFLVRQEVKR